MKRRSVTEGLFERPGGFDFYQAVRLLAHARPDRAGVGGDEFSADEVLRFRPWLSLAFPPAAIRELTPGENSEPWDMVVTFMGLYGPQGTLPRHYTELLFELERDRDPALRRFLDIFNHRMISLMFRAHEKYRYASRYRRREEDPITATLQAWLGETSRREPETAEILPRRHLLRYVGLFTQRPRSVKALEAIVDDYFDGIPVEVEQFISRWVQLPPSDQGCLDDGHGTNQLGRGIVVGTRLQDSQGKFRVRLGPLTMDQFLEFQPESRSFLQLCALVREFAGQHLAFDVQPVLRGDQVPALQLGRGASPPVQLGRTSWLAAGPLARDPDDARFEAPDALVPLGDHRA